MNEMIEQMFRFCMDYPRYADVMLKDVDYALSKYGIHKGRDYWRQIIREDSRLSASPTGISYLLDVLEVGDEQEENC